MDELIENLDPSSRLILSGAINLGVGIAGAISANAAVAAGEIAIVATLGTVGSLAVAPVLIVAGLYALNATDKEKQELLTAGSATLNAVQIGNQPVDWLEDQLKEAIVVSKYLKPKFETPTTKEKTGIDYLKDMAKDVLKDSGQGVAERLLQPSRAETGSGHSGNDPGSSRSELQAPGPMCLPGDKADSGGRRDDGNSQSHEQ